MKRIKQQEKKKQISSFLRSVLNVN